MLHDDDDKTTDISADGDGSAFNVTLSRAARDTLVRVRSETAPASLSIDGAAATEHADRAAFDAATSGWFYEAETRSVWARVPKSDGMHTVSAP